MQLRNPDGSVHDLTGATAFKLHIKTSSTTSITRDMAKQGLDTDGTLRYTWTAADWDTGNLPIPDSPYRSKSCPMEYEVVGGSSRMTFPNEGTDILKIVGQVA